MERPTGMKLRRVLAAVLAGVATSGLILVAAAPAHAVDRVKIYTIQNIGSGLCVQPPPEFRYDVGVQLVQEECDVDSAQLWTLISLGGNTYQFYNLNTLGCLDAHGPNADRTPVDTWPCSNISNQKWTLDDDRLISAIGGRCLDVAAGSLEPNAPMQIYHCTDNNAAQRFFVTEFR